MTELRHRFALEGFRDHERALFGVSMRRQLQALMPEEEIGAAILWRAGGTRSDG